MSHLLVHGEALWLRNWVAVLEVDDDHARSSTRLLRRAAGRVGLTADPGILILSSPDVGRLMGHSRVRLDDCLSIRDGRLFVEGCDAALLAERYGTPLYVVSEDQLRRNFRRIDRAFREGWPEGPVRILPSIKASFLLALRWILSQEGAGCDAFGGAELDAAVRGGTPPSLISVNGPKDQATIDRAVAIGAKITIDSVREVGLIRRAALVLGQTAVVRPRIRPDLTSLTEPSDWLEGEVPVAKVAQIYKAGIPREDLLAMGPELLGADGVEVSGAHVHVGRHRPEPDYWRHVIREIVEFLSEVREAWGGWAPREIDIGGGLPVPRDPFGRGIERVANRPARAAPVEEFATVITASLREQLRKHEFPVEGVRLEVEPGRALYGDAGVHLATVRGMKQQSRPFPWTWVETDTTENFLPDAIFEHNRWSVLVANRADAEPSMRGDLVGCSCNPDRIVPEAELPPVEPGDIVAILDTGAYQDTLASNFNLLLRPPTVLVTGDRSELIKRRETFRDLFDRDIVPERLRRVHEPIESEAPAGASARAD